jgi:hypothetical protein
MNIQSRRPWLTALGLCATIVFTVGYLAFGARPPARLPVAYAAGASAQQAGAASQAPAQPTDQNATGAQPVLWQEPHDLERRDLFFGIGGRQGAPDPAGTFRFISDKGALDDSNPKINVQDAQGRLWTVKFGPEVKSETAATRLVWAIGYHTDQDYFVKQAAISGFTRLPAENMRFEREDDGTEKVGRWKWEDNPFAGTRELDGLKTMMALIHNVDLTERNNRIVRFKQNSGQPQQLIYYVNDLGASLGSTGSWITSMPLLDKLRTESKGVPEDFVKQDFIEGVKDGVVDFQITRRQAAHIVRGVKVEHARWLGSLLGRLSADQLADAFKAGGFTEAEVTLYVREIRARITRLQNLDTQLAEPRTAQTKR